MTRLDQLLTGRRRRWCAGSQSPASASMRLASRVPTVCLRLSAQHHEWPPAPRGEPRAELERGPVVLDRPKRHEDRAASGPLALPTASAVSHGTPASTARLAASSWPSSRGDVSDVSEEEVHVGSRGQAQEVGGRVRGRECGRPHVDASIDEGGALLIERGTGGVERLRNVLAKPGFDEARQAPARGVLRARQRLDERHDLPELLGAGCRDDDHRPRLRGGPRPLPMRRA